MRNIGKIIRQSFVPTSSTVYYYPLNGDLKDYSNNQLADASNNGCEFVLESQVGKMIKFDSSGKFLTLPARANYLTNLMDRTISYILLVDNIYNDKQAIFSLGPNTGYGQSCELSLNNIWTNEDNTTPIKPCLSIATRGAGSDYASQVKLYSRTPVLITHTIKNDEQRLRTYVNGKIVNLVYLYTRGVSWQNNNIFLGKGGLSNFYSNLILAEFILEGRVWTDIEIADYAASIGF